MYRSPFKKGKEESWAGKGALCRWVVGNLQSLSSRISNLSFRFQIWAPTWNRSCYVCFCIRNIQLHSDWSAQNENICGCETFSFLLIPPIATPRLIYIYLFIHVFILVYRLSGVLLKLRIELWKINESVKCSRVQYTFPLLSNFRYIN